MPELPEVEVTRLGVAPHVEGQKVTGVILRREGLRWPFPANLEQILRHRRVLKTSRRGKYLLLHFEHGVLLVHLGMTGNLRVMPSTTPAQKHDHVDIALGNQMLRLTDPRRFGALLWHANEDGDIQEHLLLRKLGVEPLDSGFSAELLFQQSRKRAASIKQVLLAGDIVVTHRSDGSGTSAVFTDYLAKVSPSWKEKVGQGTAVNWPVGLGGKGNEGVAGLVKQTPGSIGYVEFIYAESNKLPYASLKNQSGNYVLPSTQSVTAAADANLKSIPEDFRVSITDASGKDSYPLSSFTYILVYKTQSDATKGKILVDFLRWAVKDGQKFCEPLHYSKLPKSLVSKIEAKIETIETKKL